MDNDTAFVLILFGTILVALSAFLVFMYSDLKRLLREAIAPSRSTTNSPDP